jgi:hypothetical protein
MKCQAITCFFRLFFKFFAKNVKNALFEGGIDPVFRVSEGKQKFWLTFSA